MMLSDEELNQLVENVWQTLMGSAPSSFVPGPLPPGSADWMTGSVRISGEWHGTVAVSCPKELVRQSAAQMLGLDVDSISAEDMTDALGEIANVLGGNLKSLMPAPTRLSLPEVGGAGTKDEGMLQRLEKTVIKGSFLSISGSNHPFHVAVMQTQAPAPAAS